VRFKEWFLKEEMISRLMKAQKVGLSRPEIQNIKQNSKGIVGVYDLIDMVRDNPDRFAKSVYLGLSQYQMHATVLLEKITGITRWAFAYSKLDVPLEKANTKEFLPKLVQSGAEVVFLLPDNFVQGGVTRQEYDWFHTRPEAMKNVLFVVGAYDFFSSEEYKKVAEEPAAEKPKVPQEKPGWFDTLKGFLGSKKPVQQPPETSDPTSGTSGRLRVKGYTDDYETLAMYSKAAGQTRGLTKKDAEKPIFKSLLASGVIEIVEDKGHVYVIRIKDQNSLVQAMSNLEKQIYAIHQNKPIKGYDRLRDYVLDYEKHGGGHEDKPGWIDDL
jgi:hypothetical protein